MARLPRSTVGAPPSRWLVLLLAVAACGGGAPATSRASAFTLGGTVAGLQGGSLVLEDDGRDPLVVTADGPFQFRQALPPGAAYAVAVVTQSATPARRCEVRGGSGVMGDAAVDSVAVLCSPLPAMHRVRVDVHGLVGAGLVLALDGSELLTVTADGPAAFTTLLATGDPYRVTVSTPPAGPAQACAVAAPAGTLGDADVSTAVTCSSPSAVQAWRAPASWGARWADGPTMLEHAWFDGVGLVESRGVTWALAGLAPEQHALTAFPAGVRPGAGPFTAGHYQASAGDGALGAGADLLVCAVVKPDRNPVVDGREHVILAKGKQGESGWVLMQMHSAFCFHYQEVPSGEQMIWTYSHLPNWGQDDGPLDPSYVVVCAGRSGDQLHIAVNSAPDTINTRDQPAGTAMVPTGRPLSLGGYDDGDPAHVFGGRIYEVAVWGEPATPEAIQQRFAELQGLVLPDGTAARYTRSREAPFVGADGAYHATWRHGPRLDPARGMLFGLQGWNRITAPEELELWAAAGGAAVQANVAEPPGDTGQPEAELIALAPGQSLTAPMAGGFAAGPVQGQLWVRRVSSGGVLHLRAAPGTGALDVDLGALGDGWTRVALDGFAAGGDGAAGLVLEAPGGAVQFQAWGADLTQLGAGGAGGGFDPGPEGYDWTQQADAGTDDQLLLPRPPSTGADGFCLTATAGPAEHLGWDAALADPRVAAGWDAWDLSTSARLQVQAGPAPQVCFSASGTTAAQACFSPQDWGPGTQHQLTGCWGPDGRAVLLADGAAVASATGAPAPPDLTYGVLTIGNDGAGHGSPWHGWVSAVVACRGPDPSACW